MKGGRGVKSTGARHVLRGLSLAKFFFRDTREEMLEKLGLRYVKTYAQCAKQGGNRRDKSPPLKQSSPQQKKKLCSGGDAKTCPPPQ